MANSYKDPTFEAVLRRERINLRRKNHKKKQEQDKKYYRRNLESLFKTAGR